MRFFWVVLLLVLGLGGVTGSADADLRSVVVSSIRIIPGKKGVTVKREPLKLAGIVGKKPMVMLYWNPAVAASVAELKRFDVWARKQTKSKIVFLAAARAMDDQEIEAVALAARGLELSITVLLDQQMSIAQLIQTPYLPAYYGVDASGKESFNGFGSLLDPTDAGKPLETVLAEAQNDLPAIRPAPLKVLAVGDMAPDFSLPDLDRKPVRLSSLFGGKNILLIFWSAYCPHCQKELPRMQRYLTARGNPFTAVSVTRVINAEDHAATQAFVAGEGLQFPVLVDGGQVLAKYQIKGIPQWMVLDPQGKILTIQTGEKAGLEGLLQRWEKK